MNYESAVGFVKQVYSAMKKADHVTDSFLQKVTEPIKDTIKTTYLKITKKQTDKIIVETEPLSEQEQNNLEKRCS